MSPYCSAHDEWLIIKLCMYIRYHDVNNVSNFGGDPVTQLNFKKFFYEIGLITIREVSPPFDEEQQYFASECMHDGVGLGQVKHMSLHDSHSVTPVDGTNIFKILQSKFSSAGHLFIMNRCRNVILT